VKIGQSANGCYQKENKPSVILGYFKYRKRVFLKIMKKLWHC